MDIKRVKIIGNCYLGDLGKVDELRAPVWSCEETRLGVVATHIETGQRFRIPEQKVDHVEYEPEREETHADLGSVAAAGGRRGRPAKPRGDVPA